MSSMVRNCATQGFAITARALLRKITGDPSLRWTARSPDRLNRQAHNKCRDRQRQVKEALASISAHDDASTQRGGVDHRSMSPSESAEPVGRVTPREEVGADAAVEHSGPVQRQAGGCIGFHRCRASMSCSSSSRMTSSGVTEVSGGNGTHVSQRLSCASPPAASRPKKVSPGTSASLRHTGRGYDDAGRSCRQRRSKVAQCPQRPRGSTSGSLPISVCSYHGTGWRAWVDRYRARWIISVSFGQQHAPLMSS